MSDSPISDLRELVVLRSERDAIGDELYLKSKFIYG